jgi:hypothetical protein
MDEAFNPFSNILSRLTTLDGNLVDPDAGVRTYITGVSIDTPLELDVSRDAGGRLSIGTTPPLYCLMTSAPPVYHRLSFAARLEELP